MRCQSLGRCRGTEDLSLELGLEDVLGVTGPPGLRNESCGPRPLIFPLLTLQELTFEARPDSGTRKASPGLPTEGGEESCLSTICPAPQGGSSGP